MSEDRLKYLLFRCYRCGRLITKYEILKVWEAGEKDLSAPAMGLCPCGSRHVSPTNATLAEELTLPRVWKVWIKDVVLPRLRG